jgi:hypothetical protein
MYYDVNINEHVSSIIIKNFQSTNATFNIVFFTLLFYYNGEHQGFVANWVALKMQQIAVETWLNGMWQLAFKCCLNECFCYRKRRKLSMKVKLLRKLQGVGNLSNDRERKNISF